MTMPAGATNTMENQSWLEDWHVVGIDLKNHVASGHFGNVNYLIEIDFMGMQITF